MVLERDRALSKFRNVLVRVGISVMYLGLAGAIISLVAIAPLGSGSAFPSTLIAACGAIVLLRYNYDSTLVSELRRIVNHRHRVTS
jgi:hypothetical protein